MPNDPQQQQDALARFYGLLVAVFAAVTIALISIANMPGLQDPATNQLPEPAFRALAGLPVVFMVCAALVIVFSTRRSR
jgi:hypothetical protein